MGKCESLFQYPKAYLSMPPSKTYAIVRSIYLVSRHHSFRSVYRLAITQFGIIHISMVTVPDTQPVPNCSRYLNERIEALIGDKVNTCITSI